MMRRHFTLDEANALLPWLEEQFARMMPRRNELEAQQERLIQLLRLRRSNGHSSKEEDIVATQKAVDQLTRELQEALKVITDRGILVRDLGRGLVDFPAMREEREVYLCWVMGEERIAYWHDTNTGFAGRRPL
jgi:hypothetical protein